MGSSGTTGTGWLADIERMEQEVQLAQRAVEETTGTAEAGADLVSATVTGRGELAELVLDPRVYREFAPEALAAEIVTAVNEARLEAQRKAVEVLTEKLPSHASGDDPEFGPVLAELERQRAAGPRTGAPR